MPRRSERRRTDPDFSYPEVGATDGPLPAGYRHLDRARLIGRGTARFTEAGDRVLRWQVQTGAGLRVRTDADRARAGTRVDVAVGVGPLRLWSPCRVVRVVTDSDRTGFAYGTLPGHPEIGEESFMINIDDHDQVWLRVRAFSRPGPLWARALGPLGSLTQQLITDRYLRSLD